MIAFHSFGYSEGDRQCSKEEGTKLVNASIHHRLYHSLFLPQFKIPDLHQFQYIFR